MFQKLDNEIWEEYLHDYKNRDDKVSIIGYCREKGLSKSDFFIIEGD